MCLPHTSQAAIRGEPCLPVECDFVRSRAGRSRPKRRPAPHGAIPAGFDLRYRHETVQFCSSAERHPSRVRVSSLGGYLLFALSFLRERLSSSLRLPPLPLHGYPCGLLLPYPAPSIPLLLLLHATNRKTRSTVESKTGEDTTQIKV